MRNTIYSFIYSFYCIKEKTTYSSTTMYLNTTYSCNIIMDNTTYSSTIMHLHHPPPYTPISSHTYPLSLTHTPTHTRTHTTHTHNSLSHGLIKIFNRLGLTATTAAPSTAAPSTSTILRTAHSDMSHLPARMTRFATAATIADAPSTATRLRALTGACECTMGMSMCPSQPSLKQE